MQDFADIESILIKQKGLDWHYIDSYLDHVMEYEDKSENIRFLRKLRGEYYER